MQVIDTRLPHARLDPIFAPRGESQRLVVYQRVSFGPGRQGLLHRLNTYHSADVAAADAYEFGLLVHSVFNPNHPLPPTSIPPHPAPTAASRGAIPTAVFPSYKRLLMPKPKPRMTCKAFLEIGNGEKAAEGSGFFSQNRLVKISASLEGFNLSSEAEKSSFLRFLV